MTSPFAGLSDVFTGALGEAITVTPAAGSTREINGIPTNRFVDAEGVVVQSPAFHAAAGDVEDLADDDQVTMRGVDYLVRYKRADGQGMVAVVLAEA